MSITFEGTIITQIETGEAKNGNVSYKFSIRTTGKKSEIINCTAWGSNCTGQFTKLLPDTSIIIRGFWGKPQKTFEGFEVISEDKNFILTSFRLSEETTDALADEIRAYGGEEKYREHLKDFARRKRNAGLVRVPIKRDRSGSSNGIYHQWVKQEDAVEVDGKWVFWGDFVYEQAEKVGKKEALTECFKGFMRGHAVLSGVFATDTVQHTTSTSLADFPAWKAKAIARARDVYATKLLNEGSEKSKTWEQKIAEVNII